MERLELLRTYQEVTQSELIIMLIIYSHRVCRSELTYLNLYLQPQLDPSQTRRKTQNVV